MPTLPQTAPSSYWETKIIEWENSMRDPNKKVSPIEKFAAKFREPLKIRSAKCMEFLLPHVNGKSVLELGCGSGYFAQELVTRGKVRAYQGIDISTMAVKRATSLAQEAGLADRMRFTHGNAPALDLPAADITVGLGFLDYLAPAEIETLFRNIKSPYFIFTFSEKKISFFRYVHILYLITQRCDKHFYYTQSEVRSFLGARAKDAWFYNHPSMMFGCILSNLPR